MTYYDLGNYSRKVTTASPDAQLWFDRGLIWTYGYHHEEAIVCFQKAVKADPGCVLAYWGIAYAIGPNYNKSWDDFEDEEKAAALQLAHESLTAAASHLDKVTPVERALVEALSARYPDTPPIDTFDPWKDGYANAMRKVHADYSNDLDICCLFVEAILNRTPWQLWDLPTGKPAQGANTLEAVHVLTKAFDQLPGAWDHPGLLHMYIHLMEMSPTPELALRHGDRLATLVPDAGHLLHMSTHIDVLCGDYMNVVSRNEAGIIADRVYLEREGADNFYTIYRCHNYHFKIYGAMFLGQPGPALDAANALVEQLTADVIRPMADWLESFVSMKQHVLIRFGMWRQILDQEMPDDRVLFSSTVAMMYYARTVAFANLGDLDEADAESKLFMEAREAVPKTRMLFNNSVVDLLAIAEQMMLGEFAYHKGDHEKAFEHLRRSIQLDDSLPYDEPWGWMQPTRHAYGALLLDQKRYDEAEPVYRADLGLDDTLSRACQHPGNVWSLHGLHECLMHRSETIESRHIKNQLDKAMARADVTIRASCYCRKRMANCLVEGGG